MRSVFSSVQSMYVKDKVFLMSEMPFSQFSSKAFELNKASRHLSHCNATKSCIKFYVDKTFLAGTLPNSHRRTSHILTKCKINLMHQFNPIRLMGSFLPYPWINWLLMFFGWVFQFKNLMIFQVEGTYIAYWTQKVCLLVISFRYFSKILL